MTKKELKQEAVEYAEKINLQNVNISGVVQAYLAGSEPREKQIQIDAEQIRALQKQNGELTDELTKKSDTNHQLVEQLAKLNERCSELEEQIEKMKCCGNCCRIEHCEADGVCDNWRLAE